MLIQIAEEYGLTHTTESMGWIQILQVPAQRDRARQFLVHLGSSAFVSSYLEALYRKSGPTNAEISFLPLYVYGSSLPLNGQSSSMVCSDKAAAATAMARSQIPHIPHRLGTSPMSTYSGFNISQRAAQGTFLWLVDMLKENEPHGLVLKPKDGSQGQDTFRVRNQLELEQAWMKLLADGSRRDFVACPFYSLISEWRCIFLDGEMRLCFQKTPASVVGNGEHTLAQLIAQYEKDVLKGARVLKLGGWAAGGSGGSCVKNDHASLSRVIPKGQTVHLDWCHNLSRGAQADKNINKKLRSQLEVIGSRTMRALSLRFASIDICAVSKKPKTLEDESVKNENESKVDDSCVGGIAADDAEINNAEEEMDLLVMEANSNVNTKWYLTQHPEDWELVKGIYRDAILCHFRTQAAGIIAKGM